MKLHTRHHIPLDKVLIQKHMTTQGAFKELSFHSFDSIDSTHRFIKELPLTKMTEICIAEMQTHGRGRFGREWYSPMGENIYLSARLPLEKPLSHLGGLSLVVSLAVMTCLREFALIDNIKIKWPNDILWYNKKLSGSLIEIMPITKEYSDVIIGIGLNVNSDTPPHPMPGRPWCSLHDITGHFYDRNILIAELLIELFRSITRFEQHGFQSFSSEWHAVDYLFGNTIEISRPLGPLVGKASGVNEIGALILIDEKEVTHLISSGEASLHMN